MDMQRAAEYLRQLMAGVDPDTGEVLPEDHLLQRGDVREALLTALQAMGEREGEPLRSSRPWTREDCCEIRDLYEGGMPVSQIARVTCRGVKSVRLYLNLMAGGSPYLSERVEIPEVYVPGKLCPLDPSLVKLRPENGHQPWTAEAEERLAELFGQGQSIEEISRNMKRTRGAIRSRLKKCGLDPCRSAREEADACGHAPELFPPPKEEPAPASPPSPEIAAAVSPSRRWTEEDDAFLRRAWALGEPVDRIARLAGRKDRLVRCRLIYLGLADHSLLGGETPPPELAHQGLPWYPEEIAALQRMFRQGRTHEEMAAELKRSVGVIRNRLDMLGLADDAQD